MEFLFKYKQIIKTIVAGKDLICIDPEFIYY